MPSIESEARTIRSETTSTVSATSPNNAQKSAITFFPSFEEQKNHVRQERETQAALAERAAEKQRQLAVVEQEFREAAVRQLREDDADIQERLRDKIEDLRRRRNVAAEQAIRNHEARESPQLPFYWATRGKPRTRGESAITHGRGQFGSQFRANASCERESWERTNTYDDDW